MLGSMKLLREILHSRNHVKQLLFLAPSLTVSGIWFAYILLIKFKLKS